jgi:hypothetical protein
MKTKSEFICIQPKNQESKEIFTNYLNSLHSCKVLQKNEDKVYLKSIAGEYYFWVNKDNDKDWNIVK